jgi:uncharacterized protein YndB with AHSA1/START domain
VAPESTTTLTVEQSMSASPLDIYYAWTEQFDTWFASPGSIRMRPVVGEPYWFEVVHEGGRHPHYGRFLALVPGRRIEQTWVTGRDGTEGAETVVEVLLSPNGSGALLQLTHSGFLDGAAADRHARSWPHILVRLDEVLARSRQPG